MGLLGLPLLAIAIAVMVLSVSPSTDKTEAATDGAALSLAGAPGDVVGCPDGKTAQGADPMFCVGNGSTFTLQVVADASPQANGYILVQTWIDYGDSLGDAGNGGAIVGSNVVWPDCEAATALATNTDQGGDASLDAFSIGCLTGLIGPQPSFAKGVIFEIQLTCDENNNHIVNMLAAGTAPAGTSGAQYTEFNGGAIVPSVTNAEINCVAGPTATPTATPPPIPRMSKSPALSNVFLTRQGAKIPPGSCLAGKGTTANVASLSEALNQEVVSPDPKDPSIFQQLAAFEFEVHYDSKKVCVDINVGAAFEAAGAVCIVEDDQPDSAPQLEGVARIGCVTIGKGHDIDELVAIASVDVYPQPEIYSPMKPNQDNGNVVQINNVNCDLGDEQGHAIPIFSCDDADITFRYLEGDVEPDCVIDAVDAQAIAFRWGVEKGSLIYKDFMNLEPSSQQSDSDIDINDLQFVFGRFGSTCEVPHPAQDPVNPKA